MVNKIKHRAEIDGLRAVAVIPVVLFHAGMGFHGGYIGVDVFFVISGYLITSLILADIDKGSFSIVAFWERRLRRILPAISTVILACLIAGWFILLPPDFTSLGHSIAAQALFVSNFFFWKDTGYFTAHEAKPLLHTWSLAVEEQFYILFPVFLLGLRKARRSAIVRWMGLLALVSFGLSVYLTHTHPPAAFYLLPPRAWELLLGAILAAQPATNEFRPWLNECLSWLGLVGILFPMLFYDSNTRFPGVAALPSCLGACLIILSNSSGCTSLGKILSLRPIVFVGLISYSLYLWHWPLLTFSRYRSLNSLSPLYLTAVITASFLLSILSWRYIETPFRKRSILKSRLDIIAFSGCMTAVLLTIGFSIWRVQGVASRWPPRVLQYLAGETDKDFRTEMSLLSAQQGNLVPFGYKAPDRPIDVLVWGDSHAMAVIHVLDAICREHKVRGVAATHSATAPLVGFTSPSEFSLRKDSIPYNKAIADFVAKKRVKNVLLVANWSSYISPIVPQSTKTAFWDALVRTIALLHNAGAQVFIMKDVPRPDVDIPRALAIAASVGRDPSTIGVRFADYRKRGSFENELLDKVAADFSAVVLDPGSIFKEENGLCRVEREGKALYFDGDHLSTYGSMQLRPLFEPIFRQPDQSETR